MQNEIKKKDCGEKDYFFLGGSLWKEAIKKLQVSMK